MDYEIKYKNALEWARQVMNGETGFIRREVEEIFPELKESEDERISREITEFILTHRIDEPNDIEDTNIWLAWLEKQGEKKSAWSEEDEMITLSIEQVMNCASLLNIVPEKVGKIRTWIKSLKQRIGK